MKVEHQDKIVQEVVNTILKRSNVGLKKYGVNLNRDDLTQLEWITHAQEEAMDMILYLEKMKQNYKQKTPPKE
jgi:exoribonuclease II